MDVRELYEQTNSDYKAAIRHFFNDEMITRFVNEFFKSNCYQELVSGMEEKDNETAFRGVHTLKGMSGSMGFTELYNKSVLLTEKLRNQCYDKDTEQFYTSVKQEYEKLKELVNQLS